jgi:ribosome-associated translation inhibitor RaiA|tara:strand:+ start:1432 stop:1824 length:393 start_codon:yes stop_codon:yes gene_type:complete
MDDITNNVNSAILERVERVVEALQDNSVKMGALLAVHNEKLDKQDRIDAILFEKIENLHKDMQRATDEIKKGCERDIRKIDDRLRLMEKKMWSIAGSLIVISFLVSMPGQKLLQSFLTQTPQQVIIKPVR